MKELVFGNSLDTISRHLLKGTAADHLFGNSQAFRQHWRRRQPEIGQHPKQLEVFGCIHGPFS